MSIPKNSSKVTSLSEMKSLLNPNEAIGLSDYVLRKAENCEPLDVAVLSSEHANCDSLPLRYCMHFQRDTVITLKRVEISRKPQYKQDRVALDDVGQAVKQRARRDADRSAAVLGDLGIEIPEAKP